MTRVPKYGQQKTDSKATKVGIGICFSFFLNTSVNKGDNRRFALTFSPKTTDLFFQSQHI